MKRMLTLLPVLVLLVLTIGSCKKTTSSDPKETVLSQVLENGKLWLKYEYDKGQVSKVTEYDVATGKPSNSQTFSYGHNGKLETIISYNASGKPGSKQAFAKDLGGNFTKVDFIALTGADSGKVVNRIKYTYKGGHIVKEAWVDLVTDKEYSYRKHTWYDNGNLQSTEYYGQLTPTPVLWYKAEYSPAGDSLPAALDKHRGYPINFEHFNFVAEEVHYKNEAGFGTDEYTYLMSGRKYNNKGLLSEQTITTKYISPAKPSQASDRKYEWIEIVSYNP